MISLNARQNSTRNIELTWSISVINPNQQYLLSTLKVLHSTDNWITSELVPFYAIFCKLIIIIRFMQNG